MTKQDETEYITIRVAAERLGYSAETVWRYCQTGLIAHQQARPGAAIRVEWPLRSTKPPDDTP